MPVFLTILIIIAIVIVVWGADEDADYHHERQLLLLPLSPKSNDKLLIMASSSDETKDKQQQQFDYYYDDDDDENELKTSTKTPPLSPSNQEAKIKRMILFKNENYDRSTRPVIDDRKIVTVQIGISLYHIVAMEEKYQTITFLVAVRLKWRDEFLRWNPADFRNVDTILVPSEAVWKPDILFANSVDYEQSQAVVETNMIVRSTGDILWMSPHTPRVYCTLDMSNFPFDSQTCDIKFFSWTYNGNQVDLVVEPGGNVSGYSDNNQEWTVKSITSQRHLIIYPCCKEPFPVISFTILMKRGPMFYVFNLVYPCVLIYAVALLGFFLPIQSIEKINLEVTVLLAQVVFLQVIAETMPANPEKLPLLGYLYAATMLLVSIELVSAVSVTNIYYKGKEGEEVPRWLFKLLFCWGSNQLCPKCNKPRLNLYRHEDAVEDELLLMEEDHRNKSASLVSNQLFRGSQQQQPQRHNYSKKGQHSQKQPDDEGNNNQQQQQSDDKQPLVMMRNNNQGHHRTMSISASLTSAEMLTAAADHIASSSATRWVRTRDGCLHVVVSWREVAERLDGYLFWVLVIVSFVVFCALFINVQQDK